MTKEQLAMRVMLIDDRTVEYEVVRAVRLRDLVPGADCVEEKLAGTLSLARGVFHRAQIAATVFAPRFENQPTLQ